MQTPQNQPPPIDNQSPSDSSFSLRELVDLITGRTVDNSKQSEVSGFSDLRPFPLMGIVGQQEMKISLLLALLNPLIGGVLLIGPRGTGKTTAVRSLLDFLPDHPVSNCFYGCLPQDIEEGGMDAVCPECARKFGEGQPLSRIEPAKLIELPLNSRLDDITGGLDDRVEYPDRRRITRGIFSKADLNVLYVDEVNLLSNEVTDAILDAAAFGSFYLQRGAASVKLRSRFTLVGSMNPEEGELHPQILDRFGLRVLVRGLSSTQERLEAYHRARLYRKNPESLIHQFSVETEIARREFQRSREILSDVQIPEEIAKQAVGVIRALNIDSIRAELTLLESARALAALDGRFQVKLDDIRFLAPIALRLRRSEFFEKYFTEQDKEENELKAYLQSTFGV